MVSQVINNIQTLFASISVGEVRAYLAKNGWSLRESKERLDFSKYDEASKETRSLFIPADQAHPKFRRLIPNLVFSLSVLEKREAIEIANDIACSLTTAQTSSTPDVPSPNAGTTSRIFAIFRNIASETSILNVAQTSWNYPLKSGEEVFIELNSDSECVVFGFAGKIEVSKNASKSNTILQGYPASAEHSKGDSLMAWLRQRSAAFFNADIESASRFLAAAELLVARFLFTIAETEKGQCDAEARVRATAVLACSLVHQIEPSDEAWSLVFEIVRMTLAPANLTFNLDPNNPEALWNASRNDDPNAPMNTLAWLRNQSHNIGLGISTLASIKSLQSNNQ